jgi:hypothetical protein
MMTGHAIFPLIPGPSPPEYRGRREPAHADGTWAKRGEERKKEDDAKLPSGL